jgi:nitroreductase
VIVDTHDAMPLETVKACFKNIVRERKSVRFFRDAEIDDTVVRELFDLARWSPSNCNTQPWHIYVARGETLARLREALLSTISSLRKTDKIMDISDLNQSPDLPYHMELYTPEMRARQIAHVQAQQAALGIEREDADARAGLLRANLSFFGAPHVALLFMPTFGNEREASDIGMFAQTLLLGMTAYGLAAVPQTSIALWAAPIRKVLNIDPSLKLMFGIAFGYEDKTKPGSRLVQERDHLESNIKFLD